MAKTVPDNWMSKVDSGTYKFTFYIVDSDLYNNPEILATNDSAALQSGKAVIIAESGVTGAYSIENIIIQSTINPGASTGFSTPTGFVFEIYEPLGFSLLDRILTVGRRMGRPVNFPSQAYILKLEFLGRDPTTGGSVKYPGIYLYNLRIAQIRASLGPAGAKYFCVANSIIKASQVETVTKTDITASGINTVGTFASSLQNALNEAEVNLLTDAEKKSGVKPQRIFKVEFDDSATIKQDPVRRVKRFDLISAPWAGTANSAGGDSKPSDMDDVDLRSVTINNETQLSAKITELIELNVPSFSTYVKDARENSFIVPNVFVTTTERTLLENDNNTNKERLEITLKIHVGGTFTVPRSIASEQEKLQTTRSIQEQRFDSLPILKKYNYLYTGENTEILDFQLDIEQLFVTAQSPAAGIYYADNNQQFTPTNAIKITQDEGGAVLRTESQERERAGGIFLSDVELIKINVNQSTVFDRIPASPHNQQVSETLNETDRIESHIAGQMARRDSDSQNLNMEIKGDPFWCGTPDAIRPGATLSVGDALGGDAMIGFLNFQANEKDLLIDQNRGPVDLISTGIYKVVKVESKFQMGQFTQTLEGFKDEQTNTFLTLDQLINIEVD